MVANAGPAPTVAGYRDLEVIGRGGFAVVYRATDDARNRTVAIKVLTLGIDDPVARSLFDREARGAGSLSDHPHIVTLYDSGFLGDGRPYLAMEHCPHGSVGSRLALVGPVAVADVLELGVKMAGALETAHRRGILHRDVKPENILITQYHEPALCDFGIASLADRNEGLTTLHAMTPTFAAPEVLDRGAASAASDIYSLAATLYRLLAGRAPFGSVTTEGLLRYLTTVLTEPVPPLDRSDVPAVLEGALLGAMSKSPDDRPPSAEAFGRRLQEIQRAESFEPTPMVIGEVPVGTVAGPPPIVNSTDATRRGDEPNPADSAPTGPAVTPPGPGPSPGPPPAAAAAAELTGEATVAGRRRDLTDHSPMPATGPDSDGDTAVPLLLQITVGLVVAAGAAAAVYFGLR